MHAIEKILARASGNDKVSAGEIIKAKVDFAEINDLYLQTIYSFYEMGGKKVWDRDKLCFVFDHYAPTPTIKAAQNHKEMREFGPLIVSIDSDGNNLFEQNKITYNERKEEALKDLYSKVKFIK